MFGLNIKISDKFGLNEHAVLFHGSCLNLLRDIPDKSMQLIITSPPYNIGKEYEKKLEIETYIKQQAEVIRECVRVLSDTGSICWQVGNYVNNGTIIAAIRHNRRGAGAETEKKYVDIARDRIQKAIDGTLRTRPMNKPKYDPKLNNNKLTISPWNKNEEKLEQLRLLEDQEDYHCENS